MLFADDIDVELSGRRVLRDVSCRLKKGEITALLGANGAGKTTLLRSLNGTVPVVKGKISFAGRPLSTMSRREIARRVAVVAQENETKFPVSVFEYILSGRFVRGGTFGWETADDLAAASDALNQCDLAEHSARMMNELSGGERQRIAIARALLKNAPILILDEATSALDSESEALVQSALQNLMQGRTVIVIAHRLSTVRRADRIVVIESGAIADIGSHEELMQKLGTYRRLYELQFIDLEPPRVGVATQ